MIEFLQHNNLPKKAVLIVDNASSHKIDVNFRIIFLPPNATALIQPLDQNVLRSTKLRYRNKLISHIISTSSGIVNTLKTINLRNIFEFLAEAWNSIPAELIATAWKPLLSPNVETTPNVETLGESSDSDEEMTMTVAELRDRQNNEIELLNEHDQSVLDDVSVTLSLLSELDPSATEYSVEEIIDWNDDTIAFEDYDDDGNDDENDDEKDDNTERISHISHQQGFDVLNMAYR